MQTSETLMALVEKAVEENQPISPAKWCEYALRINALATNLDNKVANYEATLAKIEAELVKQDITSAKAKTLARAEINLEDYLKTRAMVGRIGEFLSLARKRSQINEI